MQGLTGFGKGWGFIPQGVGGTEELGSGSNLISNW